jgi:hypothetical protein
MSSQVFNSPHCSQNSYPLRWALVEAAQMAVKSDPLWKTRFQEMQKRMHRNQAITAVAHRLLELVWYVLTRRQPYRHFSHERIAYKYLTWAWRMDEAARAGLTRQQFARYYMMRLGIGDDSPGLLSTPNIRAKSLRKQSFSPYDRN